MTEHDILLIQVATGATGYSEKYVNIPKGGILTSDANQTPVVVPMGATGTIPIADPTATGGIRWGVGGAGPTGPTGHTGPTGAASTVAGPTGPTGPTGPAGEGGSGASSYTLDFQASAVVMNDINLEGAITITDIIGLNVDTLKLDNVAQALGSGLSIAVANQQILAWEITRTAPGYAALGIKFTKS